MLKSKNQVETNKYELEIEVSAEAFEEALQRSYLKNKAKITINGFRPGKAPRKIIEKEYGEEVFFEDAVNDVYGPAIEEAVKEAELTLVAAPDVEVTEVSKAAGVKFKATCTTKPVVDIKDYKGITVKKTVNAVTDEAVEHEIGHMLEKNSRTISVDDRAAENGDDVVIDFEGFKDGVAFDGGKAEKFTLKLGSGQFIPGFEDQVVGHNIGDEFDINVTFPEDYQAKELAGAPVVFKIKLHEIKTTELPELDDDFVQDVSEFNTVEEYRADTRKDMERVMDEQMDAKFRTAIMTKACDNMTVEIPESMMQEKIDELIRSYAANFGLTDPKMSTDDIKKMMGLDEEAIDSTIRPAAEYQVKQELLLNAIVDAENIEVTDEELEDYIKGAAETVGATPEQIRQYFGDEYIRNEFKKEKATKIVIESATEEAPAEEPAEKEAE